MITILKLGSLLLVVATVIPSAAHVLELPGKLRLTRDRFRFLFLSCSLRLRPAQPGRFG
jgi:hypothetical protein